MQNGDHKAKHVILLAEDDEVNQEIIQAFLKDAGDFELVVANDGRAALEAALLKKFDILIVDQNMPFITGDRLIRYLRSANTMNSATPVIRFTADADQRPLNFKALNGVGEVTLPKPLRKEQLIEAMRTLLAERTKVA